MLQFLTFPLFICWLNLSSAQPLEGPTRFTLSIAENSGENDLSSKLEQGKELLGRIIDAIRIGRGRFVNSIILARNIIADQAELFPNDLGSTVTKTDKSNHSHKFLTSIQNTTPTILSHPVKRETVRLENETAQGILERKNPDNIKQILDNFARPTPIVDGIKEEEKYGNSGDKFIGIGRAIVNAYENFSNFLNTVVELPVNAAKQTSRGITEVLNQLGARIVGLE